MKGEQKIDQFLLLLNLFSLLHEMAQDPKFIALPGIMTLSLEAITSFTHRRSNGIGTNGRRALDVEAFGKKAEEGLQEQAHSDGTLIRRLLSSQHKIK